MDHIMTYRFRVHFVDNASDYLFETEQEAREFLTMIPLDTEVLFCRI